jgi:putative ABC transport system permease protein
MTTLWQDVRYGMRMLARSPGFTVIVVLILAVGIGANTAVFSVVNAVLLRPLPYQNSRDIVTIREHGVRAARILCGRPHFSFLRENNHVFESLAGFCGRLFYVTGIERPHEIHACEVTANLFPLLGIQPMLGRGFLPEEERPENAHVVILSHAFWRDYLGASPEAIGNTITLTTNKLGETVVTTGQYRESYTIVGVMPPGFTFPFGRPAPLWTPMIITEGATGAYPPPVFPLARLKRGATPAQAEADLAVLADHLRQLDPKVDLEGARFDVKRLLDRHVAGHRKLPLLLLGAAGFVLLIACGNVANLFLARATVRRREMAMRVALGASRRRVLRQMLTESLLLSVAAGVLGLLLTFSTVKGLVRLCPSDTPRLQETSVDLTVLGFTLGVAILTGLLFGMMPAWRASDVSVGETLKEGSGRTTTGRGWRRLHSGLVVSQLGLSLVLLIGSALLIRSLMALASVDLGFRPENVLVLEIRLPYAKYTSTAQRQAFFLPLLERLRALPQVQSAALFDGFGVTDALGEGGYAAPFSLSGQTDTGRRHTAKWRSVTPDFFAALGVRFLRGQTLSEQDPDGVVIDEILAREYFSGVDPVGQRLITEDGASGHKLHTILGVVDTVRSFDILAPVQGTVYAMATEFENWPALLLRTDGDPMRLAPAVRQQVADLEPDPVIRTLEPLETTLSQMLAPRRFVMILLSLFAGIALALATIGVYGLLQYATTQQTHDIGIRMALGARKTDILRAVVGQGLKLTLIGVSLGLAGAFVLTRLISSLLYGVTRTDPLTFACVSLVLAGVALLASYLPARRAARIDPMAALRCE